MQKIRRVSQKIASKTGRLGHLELQALISEEEDTIHKTQQLFIERIEAVTALKTFAATEPEEIKVAVESIAEQTESLNAAESEMISEIDANYIGKMRNLLENLEGLDIANKKKEEAIKSLEKAKMNVAKKEKAIEAAEIKGDPAKITIAKDQLEQAQTELNAKEIENQTAASQAEEKTTEFQSEKLAILKEAFTALNTARRNFYDKALAIVSGLQEKVDSLPTEVETAPTPVKEDSEETPDDSSNDEE